MGTVVVAAVEDAYRLIVLLGEVAEELAEARLVLLFDLRTGCHDEGYNASESTKKGQRQTCEGEIEVDWCDCR
jgi:hypothetical protein